MSEKWFRGAIDIHIHSSPSIFPRLYDDRALVAEAARAEMAAVVLKAHEDSTVARAKLAESVDSRVKVYGGVVLNHFVGGLNPFAAEVALALGGKVVWMPTMHAANHIAFYGEAGYKEQRMAYRSRPAPPISVLDAQGRLKPEVVAILEVMAAQGGAVLSSGHLSAKETALLFREAKSYGLTRLVVAHPELPLTGYSLDFQLEMAELGAFIERCYLPHLPAWGGYSVARTAAEVRAIGAARCLLSTDLGQRGSPPPAEGFRAFGRALLEHGLGEEELRTMMVDNPTTLLS
jgi:hypothetical protein